jgi:PKD repeat protein
MGLLSISAYAQDACDSPEPTPEQQEEYLKAVEAMRNEKALGDISINGNSNFVLLPLTVHIVRNSNGSGGISLKDFYDAFDRLNAQYIPAAVQFYICGSVNYIDDDNITDFEKNTDVSLLNSYLVAKTFNLFIVDAYTSSGSGACGFAYYPDNIDSDDLSVLKTSCVNAGTTLEHEIGHALNLRHTHQGNGSELVARPGSGKTTNCATDGDYFCDTPADPDITSWTISSVTCEVSNNANPQDANGDVYVPDGKNIMSYSPNKACRTVFSAEQYAMISSTARTHYDWTKKTCSSAPVANFNVAGEVAVAGHDVVLQDQSTGAGINNHSWTINGANISTSSAVNPTVNFASAGLYSVTLSVSNGGGSDQITQNVKVVDPIVLPYCQNFDAGSIVLDSVGTVVKSYGLLAINNSAGKSGMGVAFTGALSSGIPYYAYAQDGEKPFLTNPNFDSKLIFPSIDATNFANLQLTFDKKSMYFSKASYGNFRVLVNNTAISPTYQIGSDVEETWSTINFDLSAYDGTIFDLTFEANAKYSSSGAYLDNLMIAGDITTGVKALNVARVSVYPNPVGDVLYINANGLQAVKIINALGETVFEKALSENLVSINTADLHSGVYFVQSQINGAIATTKFIKE